MNPNDTSNEELMGTFEVEENTPSVDDFIKELEEKEKDLDISADLVIEVDDSDVEHNNIHDSFFPGTSIDKNTFQNAPKQKVQSFSPDSSADKLTFSDLQDKVKELTVERNELKESQVRRQRDFDNYRNRVERERQETFKNILSNLATQILPVLDNLNRALDSTTEAEKQSEERDFQTFLEGIVLVNQQLNEVLIEMGVQPIPSVGEPFDPKFHEAVATEETDDYPNKTVIQELLRGYRIDNRVIRASMVKVSSTTNSQPSPALELD